MKIENKTDEQHALVIVNALRKAYLTQTLADALDLMRAVNYLQSKVEEFKKNPPPSPPCINPIDQKIVPIKLPGKKK